MRQNFISTAPLQMEKNLKKAIYCSENSKLRYEAEILGEEGVCFPILQPLANLAKKDSGIVFTTIITKGNEDAQRNYELYCRNVEEILQRKGIDVCEEQFKPIFLEGKDSLSEQLGLFDAIVKSIQPEDSVCACLTFGNKPNIATLNMALEYAQKCIEGVSVEALVYGRFPHNGEGREPELYDYSALIYMNSLVNRLAQRKVENPAEQIALLLGLD